jgi:Zn-dependent protease/tetratricopeptide (TPR) repeat protein
VDDKGLLLMLLAAAGLWLAVQGARIVATLLQLRRMRFAPARAEVAGREGMPADVAMLLAPVGEALAGLGFHYEKTLRGPSMLRNGQPPDSWQDIYRHQDNGCRASIRCSEAPEPGLLVAVNFSSVCNGQTLRTENRIVHLELPQPPDLNVADALADSLEAHWQHHRRRLPEGGADPLPTAGDEDLDIASRFIDYWERTGVMARIGEYWQLTWLGAWRFLRQVLAGNRSVAALPPMVAVETVELRQLADRMVWAYQERLTADLGLSTRGKWFWFLFSLVLGLAAFSWMDSLRFAGLLLGVLLVHELGHALAMRAFGYRQLSVLVLPFLGAVAMGRKDDAGPWQKMVILLAGPLPGLLAGVICLRLAMTQPGQAEWLMEAGSILLALNLFNLLPFSPLDGGQILDTFLFARRPRLRLVFHFLSALALVMFGYYLESALLAGLGMILMAALPFAWRRVALLRGMAGVSDADGAAAAILGRLHAAPGPRWPAFSHRMQTLRLLLPWLRGRPPKWTESLAGVAIYLLVLASPLSLLWGTPGTEKLARWGGDLVYQWLNPPPDWAEQLANATTPAARWQVLYDAGQWLVENNRDEEAQVRFREALSEAEKLPLGGEGHLHRLDTRIALARLASDADGKEQLVALLPELTALPVAEQGRLADVLEAVAWQEYRQPEKRASRLRQAIEVRERQPESEDNYSLLNDRLELARLIDATGDAVGTERLLRANLAHENEHVRWLMQPYAWFLLSHGRPEEARQWLEKAPFATVSWIQSAEALPWAYLALDRHGEALVLFEQQLKAVTQRKWQPERARLEVLLDLVHASPDPKEAERWMQEVLVTKAKLGKDFRHVRRSVRHEAEEQRWESLRGVARLAVLDGLPGAEDDRREEEVARNSCRQ